MNQLSFQPDDFAMFLESQPEEEQTKGAAKLVNELEKISNLNTRASYLSKFRKAVSKRLSATAPVLQRLRFPKKFWDERSQKSNSALDDKLRNARLLTDVDEMIKIADKLLDSKIAQELMIGLSLVTGRRCIETIKGKLEDVGKETEVLFSGQVKIKGKKDVKPYLIPLLLPKERVLRAWTRLRELKPAWQKASNLAVTNIVCRITNRETKNHFNQFGLTQFKDLRAAYSAICYDKFAKNLPISETKYYSDILGHTQKDNHTGLHYCAFKIVSK
jgi:integrase